MCVCLVCAPPLAIKLCGSCKLHQARHVMGEQAGLLNYTETDGMLGIRKRAERDLEGFVAPHWGYHWFQKKRAPCMSAYKPN